MKKRSNQLRPLKFKRNFIETAAGSTLVEMGKTRVLCTASFETDLPPWRVESGLGWVTAEYDMLPASTSPRKARKTGRPDSRSLEIQRLVGRVLRAVVDFEKLGPNAICLDCHVLQADGGTRTAAINGSFVALYDAVRQGLKEKRITENPINDFVAAVSVGICFGKPVLDLDYELDSTAEVDMNIAMTGDGRFVEIQGTAEQQPFDNDRLSQMLLLAQKGIKHIITEQKRILRIR